MRVGDAKVGWDDLVLGPQTFDLAAQIGDFAIVRSDGVASYQLAVALDDSDMGITEVVRGDDLVDSTPRQLFLLGALDKPAPAYAHVPLVLSHEGIRLAKRDNAAQVGELRARGHGADEIRQNGNAAQGVEGFNVPSLLGVSVGGPYLHNGAAETLEELLDPAGDFGDHLRAGNQIFSPTDDELRDLIAFLRTIDDDTETIAVPDDMVFCPDGLPDGVQTCQAHADRRGLGIAIHAE